MLKPLLIGIGIGSIIFTKKGKDIVNTQISNLKDYMITNISNTDIVQVGREFLDGYKGLKSEKSEEDKETNDKEQKLTKKDKIISKKYVNED